MCRQERQDVEVDSAVTCRSVYQSKTGGRRTKGARRRFKRVLMMVACSEASGKLGLSLSERIFGKGAAIRWMSFIA